MGLTLTELIFLGSTKNVCQNFVLQAYAYAETVRFNDDPLAKISHDNIIKYMSDSRYFDLVLEGEDIPIDGFFFRNVFINYSKNEQQVELLFFFDIKDYGKSYSSFLYNLKNWSLEFRNKYHFDTFLCRVDEGDDGEVYFTEKGPGPLRP